MAMYDKSHYYVDFSDRDDLTKEDKEALEAIQEKYRPIERADLLTEYRIQGKITADEFETMTGIPYNFAN